MTRSQTTPVDSPRDERERALARSESGRLGFDLPRRIGPYRVLSPLGRGGMAQVVLAQDPAGHRVALKVLDPIASSDEEEDLARLRREGQLLSSVSHPNVVAVEAIGVCSTSGRGYLALEFVEGVDLADRLEIGLTRTEALHVLYQTALGLRALHGAGVVHRDLKPANVLLTATGEVKLVDLGIALEREQSRLTKTGEVLGTPDYMAPEVARGKRPTPAADVYALAATAYRLLAKRPLFQHPSPIAVVHAHVKDTPPSFLGLEPSLSPALARILDRCLAKDPAQRPELDALLDALEPMHPTISREPGATRALRRVDRQPTFDRGERFHHFVLLGELGRGATSIVYEAYHLDRQERVALKTLHPERMDERGRARFLHEVSALRIAKHPHTVELLEYGVHEGIHFLALELVDGKPLSRWIAETDRPLTERLAPLLLLCNAVEAAHREGVVHRDLKPENVLVTAEGRPKLLDFGLSRSLRRNERVTLTCDVLGTLSYMAPEQARGRSRTVDARADVYSLGAMLYEALTGRLPHSGTAQEVLLRVVHEPPLSPRLLDPRVPRAVEAVCMKALAKGREARYASAGEFAAALRAALSGLPSAERQGA